MCFFDRSENLWLLILPPLRYDWGQRYQFIGINTEGKTL
jgi:hypothetical protein